MRKFLILTLLLAAILGGCSKYREVEVEDVRLQKIRLVSASKADLQLRVLVNNPTKSTFTITDIQGTLFRDDTRFAEVSLLEEAVVHPLSREETVIKCRIHLLDPLAVLVMGLDIQSWNPEEFKLNLKTTVRSHGIKKNFKIDNIALDRVLKHVKIR